MKLQSVMVMAEVVTPTGHRTGRVTGGRARGGDSGRLEPSQGKGCGEYTGPLYLDSETQKHLRAQGYSKEHAELG